MRVSVFPHFCQHVLLLVSFIIVGAVGTVGAKLYITVILICISLIISDIEHLFMCFLAICMSSLEKALVSFMT